jgi:hypothetical protein
VICPLMCGCYDLYSVSLGVLLFVHSVRWLDHGDDGLV